MYPTPDGARPILSLRGCAFDNQSNEMYRKKQAYLHHYCGDYKENTAELQLHATLIFESDADLHPPLVSSSDDAV